MIYYANGCSYTWGGELFKLHYYIDGKDVWLPADHDHPINKKRLETVYPHHLGNLLGAKKVINEALGGGSNFRIVRKTLAYFNKLILEDKPIDNHFVTIQWTEPSRWEYYDTFEESWVSQTNISAHWEKHVRNPDRTQEKNREIYYKKLHSVQNDFVCFINHVMCLGNFFKVNKIPYLFFKHTGWDGPFYEENLVNAEEMRKLLLQFNWFHDDPVNPNMQHSGIATVKGSHPNELGHRQWAEILLQEIKKKNLVKVSKLDVL